MTRKQEEKVSEPQYYVAKDEKDEAVAYLKKLGYDAWNESGVVMVAIDNPLKNRAKIKELLDKVDYNMSWGINAPRKEKYND